MGGDVERRSGAERSLRGAHRRHRSPPVPGALPAMPPAPVAFGSKQYRLPFQTPPGAGGWYVAQWYGITTTGYRARNSAYREGQGIHFGVDFPNPLGTPVVAIAPGRV